MAIQINKRKLVLFTLPISTLILLLLLALTKSSTPPLKQPRIHTTSRVQTTAYTVAANHCSGSPYPELCLSTLTSIPQLTAKSLPQVIATVINHTTSSVQSSAARCAYLLRSRLASYEARQRVALTDCLDLFDQTMSDFHAAVADLTKHPSSTLDDLKTELSAAITNQYSCLDGFAFVSGSHNLRPVIEDELFHISRLVSNSLAMAKKIPPCKEKGKNEAFEDYGEIVKGFPKWISANDRQLLKDNATVADLVVAKDGSGNFTTIMEAVNATADHSKSRIVIYIKAGAYFENVEVVKKKTNLMFIGDGIGKTVVKASRNVVDGWTTYRSATVAIVGNGFLARDITIENAAGPSKHQAVALRDNADLSAFYRCSFVGYQDTLYVHSMRQFFRECDIYGTVDFIFGNAAALFQNCNMYARKPNVNQKNIFTAQGREDPNQNTGISIQSCKVAAAADLIPVQSQFKTYLGRPWKMYSRTVFLQSELDSLIDPAGWLEWNGDFALNTLYYGEYKNTGPGANTTARVKWPGYRVINSSTEASKFTVGPFIQGDEWLPATSVPFSVGLV